MLSTVLALTRFRDNVLKANLPGANLRASYPNTTNLTNAELTNVGWRLHEMRGTLRVPGLDSWLGQCPV